MAGGAAVSEIGGTVDLFRSSFESNSAADSQDGYGVATSGGHVQCDVLGCLSVCTICRDADDDHVDFDRDDDGTSNDDHVDLDHDDDDGATPITANHSHNPLSNHTHHVDKKARFRTLSSVNVVILTCSLATTGN